MNSASIKLLLIRHGETDWNFEGRMQGQIDINLNQRGQEQAEQTAALLRATPIDAVFSSDLQRALQTASALAKEKGFSVQPDPRLREVHLGDWQGCLVSEVENSHVSLFNLRAKDPFSFAPPGGESTPQVIDRVQSFLRDLETRHQGKTVAVVSHGFTLAVLRALYQPAPVEHLFRLVPKNGEIITLVHSVD